ncbi:nodulation protein (plasmid) [Azospirillum sp. TSH58]|uniref:efflux RND transporter permease subunit n=1 Tax=Azospirillum sp. TSH58 TaxID=664962 RepID=UPI000D5FEDC9|nr:efflux RND transporter permease subunit [Azospirillum sp. TSH58]AWJ82386.1 nodulation protein [Azospirillum sp. TSH58]PWC72898.1 nodulation protein [Azospirillum sp. TSH58]
MSWAANLSAPFIRRPVATTLLTLGLALAGALGFVGLPVSPLPQVDFPTISVTASMPGASPETMAASVATPLERHLAQIADVTEMTSSSSAGSTRITLQFGLNRDIDGAGREVQAAINAARADLPSSLRSNPTYRKVNPADAPIMILTMTSATLSQGQLYDSAATVLQQKLSQVEGIGQVSIGGSSLPAVRVELNPRALFQYGIGLEDVRAAIASANANAPKGAVEDGELRFQIYTNDQARKAEEYRSLVIAYRNGAAVRLSDVAEVSDSVEDLRNAGITNGKPSVLLMLNRQPAANIIETVDRVKAMLPELRASIPTDIDLSVSSDRTTTIRASLAEVEHTLIIAVGLVVMVVFLFLRNARAALIPSVVVPVSLVATFGAMYLLGYSLNNLSLMALTIATGFVVDDAIVVLENIARHIENGMSRTQAALRGAREVGFTVLSMSVSLVAVFIPILLMGGIVGRLFREFALTLSIAILVSMVISLTTTPMMCAVLLREPRKAKEPGRAVAALRRFGARIGAQIGGGTLRLYDRTLTAALDNSLLTMVVFAATVALSVHLFTIIPKGFFPQQDTGRLIGFVVADQSTSFTLMKEKMERFVALVQADPAVDTVVGYTGGSRTNSGFMSVSLKPLAQRDVTADAVIARLRTQLTQVPGANLYLSVMQDLRAGARQANANYQFTLQGDTLDELQTWAPRLTQALQQVPELTEVNSDQQQRGLALEVTVDRDAAARLGLSFNQINNTLYDAFGQRSASTIFNPLNQYRVIMEVAPQYREDPEMMKDILISKSGGAVSGTQATSAIAGAATADTEAARNQRINQIATTGRTAASTGSALSTGVETMVPLSAIARVSLENTPLSVNHQGPFVATTISFNLAPGISLGEGLTLIRHTMDRIGVPTTIQGSFQGTARVFQQSIGDQPVLILAALLAVYIVLGVLYESYIHPLTILSTLPSAGVGALVALMALDKELSIIALIGVILLIGIVKKNAIMMIDVALEAERSEGLDPRTAIHRACLLRFRPIMMTTVAALLGALPLALGSGDGAELRQPLGIAIVGGLVVSQMLTLYTTPVTYLYLDRFRLWCRRRWRRPEAGVAA